MGCRMSGCMAASLRYWAQVPPSTYRATKGEGDVEEALLELLGKHSLREDSKDSQLLRVKAQLEQERELEGQPRMWLHLPLSITFFPFLLTVLSSSPRYFTLSTCLIPI